MLDTCRVTHRLDAKALVKRLKQLKAEAGGTTKQVQGIYRALDERLWESDAACIKQVFTQEDRHDGLCAAQAALQSFGKTNFC